MGRRKKDNSEGIAKAVLALIFLGLIFLTGGDIQKVSQLMPVVLVGLFGLALLIGAIVLMIWILRRIPRMEVGQKSEPYRSPLRFGFSRDDRVSSRELNVIAEHRTAFSTFTEELVRSLEWRRFEMLVEGMFRADGIVAQRIRAGADGGVDLVLRDSPDGPVTAIVQCKAWSKYSVGVKPVRELFGVMAAEGSPKGYFICSGKYTQEAIEWVKFKPMTLISGSDLVDRLNCLPLEQRDLLLARITAGDFSTPTCPTCDTKMVKRSSAHGEFWGCRSFPRCRFTMRMSSAS